MLADPLRSIIELTTTSITNMDSTHLYSTQQSAFLGSKVRDNQGNMEISVGDDCRISLTYTKQ